MQRQESSSHQQLQDQQEQVLSFLEQREDCFELLGEIQMLLAMFEDAKVFFMVTPSSGSDDNKNSSENENENETNNKNNNNNDDENQEDEKSSSKPATLPAIAIHVPLRTLQGDGHSTLASVLLSVVLEQPNLFPNSCDISIRFKSMQLAPQLRSDLGDGLNEYTEQLQFAESLTIGSVASRAEEMLLNLPVAQQSSYFGCCLSCNKNQLMKKLSKVPSPLRLQLDAENVNLVAPGRDDDDKVEQEQSSSKSSKKSLTMAEKLTSKASSSSSAAAAAAAAISSNKDKIVKKEFGVDGSSSKETSEEQSSPLKSKPPMTELIPKANSQCLMCKETDNIIFIPSMRPTKKTECNFCFCEDHPLISYGDCNCICCFDCFIRFSEIAVGAKKFRRSGVGFRGFGIPCPNHPKDSLINDTGLIKMLPRRSFLHFNSFAAKEFVTKVLGGFICANPLCETGLPQVSSVQKFGLAICIFCSRPTCLQCSLESVNCKCPIMHASERVSLQDVKEKLYRSECVKVPVTSPANDGDVLCVVGKCQKVLTLPFDDVSWNNWISAYVWSEHINLRKQSTSSYICVFNGAPLNPNWSLRKNGVHPASIIFLIPFVTADLAEIAEEVDLWKFRRKVGGQSEAMSRTFISKAAKQCPQCQSPTLRYRNHQCHHISCNCGCDWCYGCGGRYPCRREPKCPVFCNERCDCIDDCPECTPSCPCEHCGGCKKCRPTGEVDGKFS